MEHNLLRGTQYLVNPPASHSGAVNRKSELGVRLFSCYGNEEEDTINESGTNDR